MSAARKTITVELTEAQFLALAAAVDDHEQSLIDNSGTFRVRVELGALQKGWEKINTAWAAHHG